MAATQMIQSQYSSITQTSRGGLTATTASEDNHLSITEVSVEGFSNVESGIAVVDNGDGGWGGADCSSESREEGEKTKRDHDVLKIPEIPGKRGVSG